MSYDDFPWIHLALYAISPFVEPETPWKERSVRIGRILLAGLLGMSAS